MQKSKIYLFVILVAALFVSLYFWSEKQNKPLRTLPYFDPPNYTGIVKNEHHTIPPFVFLNQFNEKTTEATTQGKIYVTDFFFTTCRSICPIMSNQLERVYKQYGNRNDFLILSHTVDPETDSVPQMKLYAEKHGVTNKNWLFLTGSKKLLYEIARKGYLLNAEEGNGDENDFIHTQNFALIDKEKHIRGYYDGTDTAEVSRLLKDIQILLDEYSSNK